MIRLVLFIGLLGFLGCDTAQNVTPLGEDYFIKFYGELGDQEGVSVKPTPDGGFIIGGNSIIDLGVKTNYLLLKVDALGNQEWMETYDFGSEDLFADVIVENNGYVIAGTSDINGIKKVKIIRIDSDGTQGIDYTVRKDSTENYVCKGFSQTSTGEFLIVGPRLDAVSFVPDGRSFIGRIDNSLLRDTLHFEGDPGDGIEFEKGIEVINHFDGSVNYLAFGDKINGTASDFILYQYEDDFRGNNTSETANLSDARTVDVVEIDESRYITLVTTGDVSQLVLVSENSNGNFIPTKGQIVKPGGNLQGSSLALSQDGQILISGIINEEGSVITAASILESTAFGATNWQRTFGTEFSYKSGKVITLTDGSVVFVGTAGFKEQSKVFLIKLKSNGDMK